ncbi:orf; Unknown function [Escherichia coli ISC41]|nr:orf; Unknown function [Escherichia coli ISC41]
MFTWRFCFYICNLNAALAMLGKIPGICWCVMQFAYQVVNFRIVLVGSERTFLSE